MEKEFCHEIDELETSELNDIVEIKSFNSSEFAGKSMNLYHGLNKPNEFHRLSSEEISKFNENGIDGDNLRICNGVYVNLYGDKFSFDANGKLIKNR